MSNFEARIQRQKQAIELERKKQEAEDQVALSETEAKDAQRLDRIKNDERYKEIEKIAYSQELKEALEKYRIFFGDIWSHHEKVFDISNKEQFRIEFSDKENPVGSFKIYIRFSEAEESDPYSSFAGRIAEYAVVYITWRDKPEKREAVGEIGGGKDSRRKIYSGSDAKEGLGIEFYHSQFKSTESHSVPVFYGLNDFLDYLAKLIIKRMEDRNFSEKNIYNNVIF